MSMATLITPLFLLHWGWRHWLRTLPEDRPEASPSRRQAGSRPPLYSLMWSCWSGFLMLEQGYSLFGSTRSANPSLMYLTSTPSSSASIASAAWRWRRWSCCMAAALCHHTGSQDRTRIACWGPRAGAAREGLLGNREEPDKQQGAIPALPLSTISHIQIW